MEWFILLAGVVLGFLAGRTVEYNYWHNLISQMPNTCIHGHKDWDDCPDCCH